MTNMVRNIAVSLLMLACAACAQAPGSMPYDYSVAQYTVSTPGFEKPLPMYGF